MADFEETVTIHSDFGWSICYVFGSNFIGQHSYIYDEILISDDLGYPLFYSDAAFNIGSDVDTFASTVLITSDKVYGFHFLENITFRECFGFVSDYYSIRYLISNTMLSGLDITNLFVAISNLLRACEENDINEIFLATLRLKRSIQGYWVIVER